MPAGRPRSESARRAILSATREQLAAGGYDKLSIDRVALTAGVAKQTVYRWYPSKSALVADSLLQGFVVTPVIEPHDTGDVRRDVADWVRDFVAITQNPEAVALIRGSAAAAAEDPQVARGFQGQVETLARDALAARLRRSQEDGQLRREASVSAVAEILVGSLLYRLFTHEEITTGFVYELVSILFDGIAESETSSFRRAE